MTTLRQIEANRRNAQHSCGPTTDEGKLQSCRNGLKHGYAGQGLVLPEQMGEEIQRRTEEWNSSLKPMDAFEVKLVELVAVEAVRIDQLNIEDQELATQQCAEAADDWDDLRRLDAEALALGLAKAPSIVSLRLRRSPQGCDWLIERLEGLADMLEAGGGWDAGQLALAHDGLGTPPELRRGPNRLGRGAAPDQLDRDAALAVLRAEVEMLRRKRAGTMVGHETRRRAAAELGLGLELTPQRALLRRYLAASHRRLAWLLGQFVVRRNRTAAVPRSSAWASAMRPAAAPHVGSTAEADRRPAAATPSPGPVADPGPIARGPESDMITKYLASCRP